MNETKPGAAMNEQTPCRECGAELWAHDERVRGHRFVASRMGRSTRWS